MSIIDSLSESLRGVIDLVQNNTRVQALVIGVGVALIAVSAFSFVAFSEPFSCETHEYRGEGTAESPYLVKDETDLACMRADVYAHYKQVNDIDLSEDARVNYEPIERFDGDFNGNNHQIENFELTADGKRSGFFESVRNGDVLNVRFVDADIDGEFNEGSHKIGVIAGETKNSVISGVVRGDIDAQRSVVGLATGESYESTVKVVSFGEIDVRNGVAGGVTGRLGYGSELTNYDPYYVSEVDIRAVFPRQTNNSFVDTNEKQQGTATAGGHTALNNGEVHNVGFNGEIVSDETAAGSVAANYGKIDSVKTAGTVESRGLYAGALVGVNQSETPITNVYSDANVLGRLSEGTPQRVGFIASSQSPTTTIQNAYWTTAPLLDGELQINNIIVGHGDSEVTLRNVYWSGETSSEIDGSLDHAAPNITTFENVGLLKSIDTFNADVWDGLEFTWES